MPTVIKPKYSVTPSSIPTAGALVEGEIAINAVDGRLFIRDNAANVVEVGLQPAGSPTFSSVDINGGTIDATVIGGATPAAATFTTATTTGLATLASVDINGGAIDGTVIGSTTPAAATFSTATITSADINGGNIDATTIGSATPAAATFTTLVGTTSISVDDNIPVNMGTGDDYYFEYTGTNLRLTASNPATSGDILFRDGTAATNRFRFAMDTGIFNVVTGSIQIEGVALTDGFKRFRSLTQATYDGITPDADTIYFING